MTPACAVALANVAKSRGWAIVFSTHDPAEALAINHKALLLRAGECVGYAAPPRRPSLKPRYRNVIYGVSVAKGCWIYCDSRCSSQYRRPITVGAAEAQTAVIRRNFRRSTSNAAYSEYCELNASRRQTVDRQCPPFFAEAFRVNR